MPMQGMMMHQGIVPGGPSMPMQGMPMQQGVPRSVPMHQSVPTQQSAPMQQSVPMQQIQPTTVIPPHIANNTARQSLQAIQQACPPGAMPQWPGAPPTAPPRPPWMVPALAAGRPPSPRRHTAPPVAPHCAPPPPRHLPAPPTTGPVIDAVCIFRDPDGRVSRPRRLVIILRGLPGVGKTHFARALRDLERAAGGGNVAPQKQFPKCEPSDLLQ